MDYLILLYDDVEPIDVGATFGVLSMARRRLPDLSFAGVARTAGPVRCANGLVVMADFGFDDCPPASDLIVTGGPGWAVAGKDPATLDFLKARAGGRTSLSSICTGAMILAEAGLLDDRAATTKKQVFEGEAAPLDLLGGNDAISTRSAALVESRGVLTSGGVTLGMDAMFRLLARNHGEEVAQDVARVMEYDRALAANRNALGYEF